MGLAAEPDTGGLDVVRVRPNFYMIAGAGGNIGVQIGSDGIVLVNAGTEAASGQVLAALQKLTPLPIRYVIDTNADADFVGGNGKLAKAGKTIFTNVLGNPALAEAMTNGGAAAILAHDSILRRMSAPTGKTSPFPDDALPTEAFYPKRQTLRMNDEGIEVLYQPAAHSDADSFVFFRGSDVVVAGDVLDTTRFPVIDTGERRQHPGRDRRAEQVDRTGDRADAFHLQGRRDVRDSRSRPALRTDGRCGLSRHGGDGARRDRGHDQAGNDAGSNQGGVSGHAL